MKNARTMLMAAALVAAPATAGAQVTNHVSWQMGFAAGGQPAWHSPGIGLAYQPLALGTGFGFGFGVGISLGFGFNSHDDYWAGYHDGFLGRSHCWDVYWYDPFYDDCWGYGSFGYNPFGYSPFGWQSWHNPWWRPHGFLGWPSRRYIARHYYAWAPVWPAYRPYGLYGGRYWGYDHWDRGWGPDPRRQYARRGYGGRSPLFGPQFKEPPVYVTDNGPERPVAKLRPRAPQGAVDDVADRRGRGALDRGAQLRDTRTRTARPAAQPAGGHDGEPEAVHARHPRPHHAAQARGRGPRRTAGRSPPCGLRRPGARRPRRAFRPRSASASRPPGPHLPGARRPGSGRRPGRPRPGQPRRGARRPRCSPRQDARRPRSVRLRDAHRPRLVRHRTVRRPRPAPHRGVRRPRLAPHRGVRRPRLAPRRSVRRPRLVRHRGVRRPRPVRHRGVRRPAGPEDKARCQPEFTCCKLYLTSVAYRSTGTPSLTSPLRGLAPTQ